MMGMRAKKICMAMLLIVGGIVAVFLAHRKVAEKITEEEYQRFLDGEVPAMKENGKTYFLEDLFGEDVLPPGCLRPPGGSGRPGPAGAWPTAPRGTSGAGSRTRRTGRNRGTRAGPGRERACGSSRSPLRRRSSSPW